MDIKQQKGIYSAYALWVALKSVSRNSPCYKTCQAYFNGTCKESTRIKIDKLIAKCEDKD